MEKVINSNCKKCPEHLTNRCEGEDENCLCKFCPRNMSVCIKVKWCRETESSIIFEQS
ncbi:alpha/beta hydrolase [Fervidicella metallireducens AeB]|uniref:Alpha/beta hydrolase n=1 Tax=Fervidicella metallireducens AeB TaxID=1403537 RepID=A0A017RTH4_9CLOT|nr:hypothetical protein [Fervidicella metallireducens]EYE87962.1 alpha/beta hydrolase [Fervidicella metallireducens AeB]